MKNISLFLESIKNNQIIIFGEDHSPQERTRIETHIRKLKPDYILSEELGPYKYFTQKEILKGIREKKYSNSDRTFKLGLELNIPVIGIDVWDNLPTNLIQQFKIREKYMVNTINSYRNKGLICVIIGDAHLRTIKTKELGNSSPLNRIRNIKIYRSKNREID